MARKARDNRPRSQQIAADIRAKILSRDLPPGSKLPSTPQLGSQFSVPGTTIQSAVAILKAEGFVEGQMGRGVFVRDQSQQTITPAEYVIPVGQGQRYNWLTVAEQRAQRSSIELLGVSEVPASAEVAEAFKLDIGALVICRSMLLLLDDEPTELVHNHYPLSIARGTPLQDRRKIKGGAPALLEARGHSPGRVEDVIMTRPPTVDEFETLDLPTEVPVLRTFRITFDQDQTPIETTTSVKAGHRFKLRYFMYPDTIRMDAGGRHGP